MTDTTFTAALSSAVIIAVTHTLIGLDHWVPFVALGRLENWSVRRLARRTASFGFVHCIASLVPAFFFAGRLPSCATELRSTTAATILIVLGTLMSLRPASVRSSVRFWWLFVVFVLGPCEWLITDASRILADHGASGFAAVGIVFTTVTVATMVAATLFAERVLPRRLEALRPAISVRLAGFVLAASGTAVLAGL